VSSLRNKIFRAYGYSKLVMLAFAVVVFADLFYLYRQIESGQAVTDFREAVLEMRRDEKNLFLYRDFSSLDQLMLQVDAAGAALREGRPAFAAIAGEAAMLRSRPCCSATTTNSNATPYSTDPASWRRANRFARPGTR
jgi:hypothetical protein